MDGIIAARRLRDNRDASVTEIHSQAGIRNSADHWRMEDEEEGPRRPRSRRSRGGQPVRPTVDRTTRRLAIAATVLAVLGVALAAWHQFGPGASACQSKAWGAAPAAASLPAGWTIGATQYQPNVLSVTISGPAPADQTSASPVVYATVSCYADDAAGAVSRSQTAAAAAGMLVVSQSDYGEQGYSATDSASGSTFIQFRIGNVVSYVAASGDATAADVTTIASAFDVALGGNGLTAAIPTVAPTDTGAIPTGDTGTPGASDLPTTEPSLAAPELEAALPTTVGGTTLSVSSATGTTVLGTDPGSRAIAAALRTAGVPVDAFRAAQAYDPSGTVDLTITAFRVEGMTSDALKTIVLNSWLSAGAAGVTTSDTTVSGRAATKVDYGDGGAPSYLVVNGEIVFVVETSDATLATQAVAALPGTG
jgi:hypothetical protein